MKWSAVKAFVQQGEKTTVDNNGYAISQTHQSHCKLPICIISRHTNKLINKILRHEKRKMSKSNQKTETFSISTPVSTDQWLVHLNRTWKVLILHFRPFVLLLTKSKPLSVGDKLHTYLKGKNFLIANFVTFKTLSAHLTVSIYILHEVKTTTSDGFLSSAQNTFKPFVPSLMCK